MRARLARYAHLDPVQFGRMTPAQTRVLDRDVMALMNAEWDLQFELAKLTAMSRVG